MAVCDQIRAVDKTRLAERMGVLSPADLKTVGAGAAVVRGL